MIDALTAADGNGDVLCHRARKTRSAGGDSVDANTKRWDFVVAGAICHGVRSYRRRVVRDNYCCPAGVTDGSHQTSVLTLSLEVSTCEEKQDGRQK
jgi:hypothetical protein